jgi:formylglycine-generating enzyme required for sulfatase activity
MKIFISYRRADSATITGRIYDGLVAAFGASSIFRDIDDIPAGKDFRTVLENATSECDIMLVIMGPQWTGIKDVQGNLRLFDPDDFVRIEVETGFNREDTLVIPVLVNGTFMPSPEELPESLQEIVYRNAVNIRNDPDFHDDLQRLISSINSSQGFVIEDLSLQYFEPETIYIPAGTFLMGSPDGGEFPKHETPRHEVTLPAYHIGKYPLTNEQYEEFIRDTNRLVQPSMGWNGQRFPKGRENYPVIGVTWYEALAYCQWLSEKTGRSYILPNEAQWEKACWAGVKSIYPWGDEFDEARCNHGKSTLAPVDAYPPQNDFGCFDLVGNVRQWTCTLWGEKRIAPDPKFTYPWKDDRRNNLNASRQMRRVVRGGSMNDEIALLRCSARSGQTPDDPGLPGARTGFRVGMKVNS